MQTAARYCHEFYATPGPATNSQKNVDGEMQDAHPAVILCEGPNVLMENRSKNKLNYQSVDRSPRETLPKIR